MFLNCAQKNIRIFNNMDKIYSFRINKEIKFQIKIIDYVNIINHDIITVIKKVITHNIV